MNTLILLVCLAAFLITPTLQFLHTSPATAERNAAFAHRIRRRVNQYKGDGPVEYMKSLRNSLSDENGAPLDIQNNPTSVWCLMESDVIDEVYHPKPRNRKCEMVQNFKFRVKSLSAALDDPTTTTISKAVLRVYIQPIKRLMKLEHGKVDLLVNISARTIFNGSDCGGSSLVSSHIMTVTDETKDHWEEWNVTDGFKGCWGASESNVTSVEFSVRFSKMQCVPGKKKIPIEITDPASIPTNEEERRNRHWPLQPFTLVFLDNEEERKRLMPQKTKVTEKKYHVIEESEVDVNIGARQARSTKPELCNTTDFYINFANLGLHYVLSPSSYNAKQCKGDCSKRHLDKLEDEVNNHAKLLIYTRAWYNQLSEAEQSSFVDIPEDPQCISTKFKSLTLLTALHSEGIRYNTYSDMMTTGCGCRA